MLSVMVPTPSARHSATPIWGCMSVGKPGYGRVLTLQEYSVGRPTTRMESPCSITSQPISISLAEMASMCWGMMRFTVTSPLVTAAAIMNVPASIWSGMMVYSVPCSRSTPVMRITSMPAPLIFAPMEFSMLATSTMWGSLAAFSMIVVPRASDAASIRLMVAPTEAISR